MKLKYIKDEPNRHGARLLKSGDKIETTEAEGKALIASGLYEEIKQKAAKPQADTIKGAKNGRND